MAVKGAMLVGTVGTTVLLVWLTVVLSGALDKLNKAESEYETMEPLLHRVEAFVAEARETSLLNPLRLFVPTTSIAANLTKLAVYDFSTVANMVSDAATAYVAESLRLGEVGDVSSTNAALFIAAIANKTKLMKFGDGSSISAAAGGASVTLPEASTIEAFDPLTMFIEQASDKDTLTMLGKTCDVFSTNAKAVDWQGTYPRVQMSFVADTDGSWNVNDEVADVVDSTLDLCLRLKGLSKDPCVDAILCSTLFLTGASSACQCTPSTTPEVVSVTATVTLQPGAVAVIVGTVEFAAGATLSIAPGASLTADVITFTAQSTLAFAVAASGVPAITSTGAVTLAGALTVTVEQGTFGPGTSILLITFGTEAQGSFSSIEIVVTSTRGTRSLLQSTVGAVACTPGSAGGQCTLNAVSPSSPDNDDDNTTIIAIIATVAGVAVIAALVAALVVVRSRKRSANGKAVDPLPPPGTHSAASAGDSAPAAADPQHAAALASSTESISMSSATSSASSAMGSSSATDSSASSATGSSASASASSASLSTASGSGSGSSSF